MFGQLLVGIQCCTLEGLLLVVAWREGVGILLDIRELLRSAGELWKPVNSRMIMVRLKWTQQQWQGSDKTFVTIICVYEPTGKAPPNVRS